MADSYEIPIANKSAQAVPVVPSSTSEISIRTMASDIELMGKSGGTVGQNMAFGHVQHVAVSSAPLPAMSSTGVEAAHSTSLKDTSSTRFVMWVVVIFIIGGALFAAGFYLYPLFVK
jgi:hypothetical protein